MLSFEQGLGPRCVGLTWALPRCSRHVAWSQHRPVMHGCMDEHACTHGSGSLTHRPPYEVILQWGLIIWPCLPKVSIQIILAASSKSFLVLDAEEAV